MSDTVVILICCLVFPFKNANGSLKSYSWSTDAILSIDYNLYKKAIF